MSIHFPFSNRRAGAFEVEEGWTPTCVIRIGQAPGEATLHEAAMRDHQSRSSLARVLYRLARDAFVQRCERDDIGVVGNELANLAKGSGPLRHWWKPTVFQTASICGPAISSVSLTAKPSAIAVSTPRVVPFPATT